MQMITKKNTYGSMNASVWWRPLIGLLAAVSVSAPLAAGCSLTETGLVPLTDLGSGLYQGLYEGGLYDKGASIRPGKLRKAAKKRMKNIEPLDRFGNPDGNGSIVMISVGLSNTKLGFQNFQDRAERDPSVSSKIVMFNGAQGGASAPKWAGHNDQPWTKMLSFIRRDGFTPEQVQVAWVKHAHSKPAEFGPFPTHAEVLQQDIENSLRALLRNFPNIQLVYLSSRSRAYTDDPSKQSPEPYAYEEGFSAKWLIAKQMSGDPDLNYDPKKGEVVAPLVLWGPYIWADGTQGRSDGFVWNCNDTRSNEFIHPSDKGMQKVGSQLLAFFKTHPTTRSWFLTSVPNSDRPKVTVSADRKRGSAPLRVEFGVDTTLGGSAARIDEYNWTFDDGTFSRDRNPVKTFTEAGTYKAWVTVTDNLGNTKSKKKKITVTK
jgi:hypothetical protein